MLGAAVKLMEERADELKFLLAAETGQPPTIVDMMQYGAAMSSFNYYVGAADKFTWQDIRDGIYGQTLVLKEPIGVVGAVTAWNVPFFLAANKLGPALLAGCTVVLKPAAETPLSVFAMAEMFAEAGLPEGVLSIVPGGAETGRALTANPELDKYTFTGSSGVGKEIAKIAAENLKACTLELGGKSAAIILEDADLDSTLPMLVFSGLMNCGQACVGQTRILAPRSRYDEVVEKLVGRRRRDADRAARQRRRDDRPADLREAARARRGLHQEGRRGRRPHRHRRRPARGPRQRLVRRADGVRRRRQLDGHRPGGDLRPGARGDPVRRRGRRQSASPTTRRTGWPAACTPPTSRRRCEIAKKIRTGTYAVNMYAFDPGAPFGGYKNSGIGRENGPEGIEAYCEAKSVLLPFGYTP